MISIIMIVYDVEDYVEESIKSVLNQTYRDFELILVVGEGPDRSEEICRKYAARDERIVLITGPANGIADARNQGMAAVRGDYLGFVDSDDYIEPDMFESMISNIEKYDADISICGRFYEYRNRTLKDEAKECVVLTADEAIGVTLSHEGFFLHCWDKLFSKKVFEGLSFRTDVKVEDRIVVDKLLSKADRIVYDSTPKYHFRERSGSNSKRRGMIRNNVIANELMQDFILKNHPAIADKCQKFMLYEYITAVQNLITSEENNAQDYAEYRDKIKVLSKEVGDGAGKVLKIKSFLAVYMPAVLKIYTGKMLKSTADEYERFP